MIVLSVLLFILGAAVLVTGLMGLTGTLPGNRWVGLRIPEVRKSKDMWVTGHRIAGPFWTGAGVALLLAGLVSLQGGWLWAVTVVLAVGSLALIGTGAANAAHIMAQIDLRKGQAAEARRAAAGCCSSGGATGAAKAPSSAGGLTVPPVSASAGSAGSAAGDSCGGSCSDCGACDHGEADVPDLEAARRAMAARDSE
ncbi:SdpI family protein [uncultured Corynebacterium sp.]|uniref:SdpI family protein n=1 Tax=uncultured Corynebacterium sp. TaxID=159447 RepID=UPI0025DF8BB9|nr:SdpI family protein [uncultured Corynebacterium sp.]